jgi:hypothetical protein
MQDHEQMAVGLHRPLPARLIAEPAVEFVGNLPGEGKQGADAGVSHE